MQELRDDPVYEDVKTSHLLSALDAAMQVQKKKVISGPNDWVGILLYNTVSSHDNEMFGSEFIFSCSLSGTRVIPVHPRLRRVLLFTSIWHPLVRRQYKNSWV